MYLLYCDAAGTPEVADPGSRNFVLLGLAIPENNWFAFEKRLSTLKRQYAHQGRSFELHAKDICRNYTEQERIADFDDLDYAARRARVLEMRNTKLLGLSRDQRRDRLAMYRATDPFVHLSRTERSALFEDALRLIGSHRQVRLFAEVVDKKHLLARTGELNPVRHALEQLLSRFDQFLGRVQRAGRRQAGLVVMDKDQANEAKMRQLTEEFRTRGHMFGSLQYVLETPFFVDSATVNAVQCADLCAYAVRRYVEYGTGTADTHEERLFRLLWPRFDQSRGRLHGIRHFCRPGSCTCLVCDARSRSSAGDGA